LAIPPSPPLTTQRPSEEIDAVFISPAGLVNARASTIVPRLSRFHSWAVPSELDDSDSVARALSSPVASALGPATASDRIGPLCSSNLTTRAVGSLAWSSQVRTVPSLDAVTATWPSGVTAACVIACVCPSRTMTLRWGTRVLASHSIARPS
jgi:hypothetical protein